MKSKYKYLNDVKIDYSFYDEKPLTDIEKKKMKQITKPKKNNYGKIAIIAACITIIAVFSQTALAKEFIGNIVKIISTGHNEFVQVDEKNISAKIPPELSGIIFDKDGNPSEVYIEGKTYYDKNGNEISDVKTYMRENINITKVDNKDGDSTIILSDKSTDPLILDEQDGSLIIKDINKIKEYTAFTPLLPSYLPSGFSFYGASCEKDSNKYLFVYYKNKKTGKWFVIDERLIDEETKFSMDTGGSIEETKINGHKAVISDDRNINWEENDVAIGINGKDVLTKEELLTTAKSIK